MFCQDCANIRLIMHLASRTEIFMILLLGAFDAVFLASVSAFSLSFIGEWPKFHINLTTLPLVRCAAMAK